MADSTANNALGATEPRLTLGQMLLAALAGGENDKLKLTQDSITQSGGFDALVEVSGAVIIAHTFDCGVGADHRRRLTVAFVPEPMAFHVDNMGRTVRGRFSSSVSFTYAAAGDLTPALVARAVEAARKESEHKIEAVLASVTAIKQMVSGVMVTPPTTDTLLACAEARVGDELADAGEGPPF